MMMQCITYAVGADDVPLDGGAGNDGRCGQKQRNQAQPVHGVSAREDKL